MSSPKTNCIRCSSEFLQVTADLTGGYCMKCCWKRFDGKFIPHPEKKELPPPRPWKEILSRFKNLPERVDSMLELGRIPVSSLPDPVQRWYSAYWLNVYLGNGWSTVVSQNTDHLVKGVGGFEDCGFEIGAQPGRELIAAFVACGYDPTWPDFEGRVRLTAEQYVELEAVISRIDSEYINRIWDSSADFDAKMIARAQALAGSEI